MKFWEAMKALEAGKMVRRVCWPKDHWVNSRIDSDGHPICSTNLAIGIHAEWELYQEPERTYSFMEIVPLLKEGRKFKRSCWHSFSYLSCSLMGQDVIVLNPFIGTDYWKASLDSLEATDWIEVK